ncbi:hypothetical protein KRX51_09510 [Corynebacterium sp. TAE3-ERU12]|uniref:hypothetical protein n=1 Tax=Corynebacterium sp. TAE3-ERU12 TaxID=2849491 RepID=UPI001C440B82|nr:hypothetical protein [Corynebacterium sp. TAE3-ERU12]MBV7296145.1 hypothetical protein [Corynebacterium sp. TAE3-ERU12]
MSVPFRRHHGPWLDPDKTLGRYADWHDITTWPTSSRQTENLRRSPERPKNSPDGE